MVLNKRIMRQAFLRCKYPRQWNLHWINYFTAITLTQSKYLTTCINHYESFPLSSNSNKALHIVCLYYSALKHIKSKKKNSQIIEIPVIINAFNIYISVLAHMVCRGTRLILVRICIIYGKSPV